MLKGKKEIWVILYDTASDALCLVSKTSELATEREFICRVWFLAAILTAEDTVRLNKAGAERITHIPVEEFDSNCEYDVRNCLTDAIVKEKPDIVLFISSIFSSSVAPGVAALLKVGITADCTQLFWDDKGNFVQSRPAFGGRIQADIRSQTYPVIATVRRGMFNLKSRTPSKPPETDVVILKRDTPFCQVLANISTGTSLGLSRAEIIVAGGIGMGGKLYFARLYELASRIGGEVAASRSAVAAGYARFDRQVGQTGIVVRPKLYLAFGISGAVQHLSGMIGSENIIAINIDRKAPIHSISNYSIYADANEVIERLLMELPEKDKNHST